jgi:hypothetical protein
MDFFGYDFLEEGGSELLKLGGHFPAGFLVEDLEDFEVGQFEGGLEVCGL